MFCGQCGGNAGDNRFCERCGARIAPSTQPPRASALGVSDSPTSPATNLHGRSVGRPDAAERLAATVKVVGLSGCLLALLFWVVIPVVVLMVAIAATSSEGLAAVAAVVALIGGFIYWVWRSTGR